MGYDEHRIATKDGLKLYLRDYAPAAGRQGLPVLCLPGLTRNSADFEGIAPRMAQRGRRVLALDLRGRGNSDYDPEPVRYRPDVYAQDVVQMLDALAVPKVVFVGTSLGGLLTMMIAAMAPDRVAAGVLNDIGPVVDPAGIARIASYVGKSGPLASWDEMIAGIKATQAAMFPRADEAFWKTMAHRVARELPDGRVAFAYDPAIAQNFSQPQPSPAPSLLPFFQALAAKPVLVLRGAISDILSKGGVKVMKDAKRDLEAVEIPDVGHAPSLDEPESWDAIAGFLAGVP
jgi:pimeloyl-ACP methyl ester carboxylesterase